LLTLAVLFMGVPQVRMPAGSRAIRIDETVSVLESRSHARGLGRPSEHFRGWATPWCSLHPEGRLGLRTEEPALPETFFSHESAIVESGAEIGDDTRIWHHCHVRDGASIGSGCNLGKNVFVDSGAVIGDGVKIQNNVSVYSGVTLEDEVFVGPSAVFTNDLYPRASNPGWEVTRTLVGRGASIGANATIICGNDIGPFATVGSGAVVVRPVEDHSLVVGNPARVLGWVCDCGQVAARGTERPSKIRCERCEEHQ
jgi:acetyltransferase-like isoleucine patch superfamily enzyme